MATMVSIVYTCPCNGHAYPSKTALQSHRKTKSHIAWQDREELRELKNCPHSTGQHDFVASKSGGCVTIAQYAAD